MSASGLQLEVASLDGAAAWEPWLSADEAQYAAGMLQPALRARFVVSRGLRRKVLAGILGGKSEELLIVEDSATKPRLRDGRGWDFNLSHAGDYVALVIGRGEVGVDLEKMRPVRNLAALVERYFHPDEAAAWRASGAGRREEAFFILWSAREAAMKCAGLGLARGLALTRVDPEILRAESASGTVGGKVVLLRRATAPEGYVLVTAESVS